MATASMALQVNTQQEMESMIQGYIAQGFNIANRTPTSVTLVKRKEFSILWAVIGFIICLLPLLIYLIVYASQSDQMVTISLAGSQPAAGYGAPAIASPAAVASNPGYGTSQPAATSSSGYQLSPDGQYFWDGQQWRPVAQLPAQTGPLPGQSVPGYGQSGPLPDASSAGYQPQSPNPYQGQGQDPAQSGPLYGQGQGGYPTYPGSGSGSGSGQ